MILVKNKTELQNRLNEAIEKGFGLDNKWVYLKIRSEKDDKVVERVYGPFDEDEALDMTDGLENEGFYEFEIIDDDDMTQLDLDDIDVYSFPGADDEVVEFDDEEEELEEAKKNKLPKRVPVNRTIGDSEFFNKGFVKASDAMADGVVGEVAISEAIDEDTLQEDADKAVEVLENPDNYEDLFLALNSVLVPQSGKANSLAGELVRAANYLNYRFYNDGEIFYFNAIDDLGPAAQFLMNNCEPAKNILEEMIRLSDTEDNYLEGLIDLTTALTDYINEHRETLTTPNEEDSYNTEIKFGDLIKKSVLEYPLSEMLEYHIDNNNTTADRVIEQISDVVKDWGCGEASFIEDEWGYKIIVEEVPDIAYMDVYSDIEDELDNLCVSLDNEFGNVYDSGFTEDEYEDDEGEDEDE